MLFTNGLALIIVFFSSTISTATSELINDCRYADVIGMGPSQFDDLVGKLAISFAQNRTDNNVQSRIIYQTSTVTDSTNALIGESSHPTVYMMTLQLPTSPDDNLKYPNLKMFPIAACGIAVTFNLPNINDLVLSLEIVAQMYVGEIVYWNDTKIQALNKNVKLPGALIRPVARGDSNGATYIFTDSLSSINTTWKQKYGRITGPNFVDGVCCNSTTWPPAVQYFGNGVTGMIGIVTSIPYTIGYSSVPIIIKNKATYASLVNDAGKVIPPSIDGVQAAMDYAAIANGGGYSFSLNNAKFDTAYPIASFGYVRINLTSHLNASCCEVRELVAFLDWFLFSVNSSVVNSLGWNKLPYSMALEIQRSIFQGITCKGQPMYQAYLESLLKPTYPVQTSVIIVGVVCGVVVIGLIIAMALYVVHLKNQQRSQEMKWFIPVGMITLPITKGGILLEEAERQLAQTPRSSSDGETSYSNSERVKHMMTIATYKDNMVYMDKLENLPYPTMWKNKTKECIVRMMEDVTHRNVLTLRGATIWQTDSYAVFDSCSKGTLHYVLNTCKYELNEAVTYNLAMDIIEGLKFLHLKNLTPHSINSLTCMVDGSWTVKIGQWHWDSLYAIEDIGHSKSIAKYDKGKLLELPEIIELVYLDWETYPSRLPASDIYSVGMLILEIYSTKLPYSYEIENGLLSYPTIFEMKFIDKAFSVLPEMDQYGISSSVRDIIRSCLVTYNGRPSIRQLGSVMKSTKPNDKGMVEAMMDLIESHSDKLEEKTVQLQEVTERMESLLHEVLPPQIATKMFQGESVPPESFDNASICFADIVGFTVISAKSTPQEVMSFLNDLWIAFDTIIQKFDVYKVDTIGDAYMVCSGLPVRNGNKHGKSIASFSLALVEECQNFKIFHLPHEKAEIRVGINTGPVTAGIVGSKMPQYCVFGDAVNTAARMQSTSLPMKIQLSENAFNLLDKHYPEFECKLRGDLEVKLIRSDWSLIKNLKTRQRSIDRDSEDS